MSRSPTVALTDQDVLKQLQHLGDTLAASLAQKDPPYLNFRRISHHTPDDWGHQVKLLEDLAVLVSGDVAARPAFVGWMSLYIRNALSALLESRRSSLSLAAMAVLDCMILRQSASNRSATATICAWFLPFLLRVAASSTSSTATSAAASKLLSSIASACLITLEGFNVLCTACAAMRAPVRRRAVDVLQAYLQAVRGTPHQLATSVYTDALHRVLRDGVMDADAEVRAGARRCFWALYLLEPVSTEALLRVLPPSVRRQLNDERARTLEKFQAVVAASMDATDTARKEHRHAETSPGMREVSRTVTLKDELQAAAASRARARSSSYGSTTTQWRRHQLLLTSKDLPYDPDRRPVITHQVSVPCEGAPPQRQVSFLHSIESTDWFVRRAALLQASQLCEDGGLTDDVPSLVEVLLLRLRDTHFRVVEAAQACLRSCLQRWPAAVQETLRGLRDDLFLTLFSNSMHVKPTIRRGAYILLDTLLRLCDTPAKLVERVLQSTDVMHSYEMQAQVADFLLYVVFVLPTLFAQQSVVGAVMCCTIAHLSAAQADLSVDAHRAAAGYAAAAWERVLGGAALACPDVFRDVVERLPPSEKETVCTALRDCFGLSRNAIESDNGTNPNSPVLPTEMRACVFAEHVKQAFAAEQAGSSDYRRGSHPTSLKPKTGGSNNASLPLNFVPPATIPSILRELFVRRQKDAIVGSTLLLSGNDLLPQKDKQPGKCEAVKQRSVPLPSTQPSAPAVVNQIVSCPTEECCSADATDAAGHRVHWEGTDDAQSRLNDCVVDRNAPAVFLREWPCCRDAADKRASLLRVAAAFKYYAAHQKNSFNGVTADGAVSGLQCEAEEAERLLVCWEREIAAAEYASDHLLRWAVLYALETLLLWPAARAAVARQLTRVLNMCRIGFDDVFVEVQLQAAACVQAALVLSKLSLDLWLRAITKCLSKWIEGPHCDDATQGRLELLHILRRLFEQEQRTLLKTSKVSLNRQAEETSLSVSAVNSAILSLSSSVLRRVVGLVCQCLRHCNPVVRLSAVLALVALQQTMGETTVAPFLAVLTPAQHRVLRVYRAKDALLFTGLA